MNKDKKTPILDEPLNSNERFLYSIAVRLDILIHMMSNFLEVYASKNNIPTTNNKVVEGVVKSENVKPPEKSVSVEEEKVVKPKTTQRKKKQ